MEALFLEHEGYFGALGAFLLSQGIQKQSFDDDNGIVQNQFDESMHSERPKQRRARSLSN